MELASSSRRDVPLVVELCRIKNGRESAQNEHQLSSTARKESRLTSRHRGRGRCPYRSCSAPEQSATYEGTPRWRRPKHARHRFTFALAPLLARAQPQEGLTNPRDTSTRAH